METKQLKTAEDVLTIFNTVIKDGRESRVKYNALLPITLIIARKKKDGGLTTDIIPMPYSTPEEKTKCELLAGFAIQKIAAIKEVVLEAVITVNDSFFNVLPKETDVNDKELMNREYRKLAEDQYKRSALFFHMQQAGGTRSIVYEYIEDEDGEGVVISEKPTFDEIMVSESQESFIRQQARFGMNYDVEKTK